MQAGRRRIENTKWKHNRLYSRYHGYPKNIIVNAEMEVYTVWYNVHIFVVFLLFFIFFLIMSQWDIYYWKEVKGQKYLCI